MSEQGSVTHLIRMLKDGDSEAAQSLWDAYFHRLVELARARLNPRLRRAADEEDVALSAFESFFRRSERGQFPRLENRDDLWQILFVLTVRKAINLAHREGRMSRGAGRVRTLADLADFDLDEVAGPDRGPALAAEMAEQYRSLLDRLPDESLRLVARRKVEG